MGRECVDTALNVNQRMSAMPTHLVLLALVTVFVVDGCSLPQIGAMRLANSAIKEGNYNYALQELAAAENYKEPTDELKAEIAFLRGRSYEGLNRMPEAIEMFRYVADTFPANPYGYLAKEKLRQLESGTVVIPDTQATVEKRQYLRIVKDKMESRWTHPCGKKSAVDPNCFLAEADVILQFGVNPDGQLAFVKVQKSSGITAYDEHAVSALKDAAPFDILPESVRLRESPLRVTVRFSYRKKK